GELLWLEIVRETPVDDRRAGVLNAILDGWSHRDAEDVGDSALTCVKAVTDDARLTDAIGRFLREQGRRRVDSGDLAASFEMRDIARELWDHHSATFAHGYSPDGLVSMVPLYLNSWPGHLAHFWLYEIDRCWRQNRED